MNETKPVIALVRGERSNKWKVELRDLKSFRQLLGPEVVNAFCRCFVHADRLTSLISFGYLSDRYYDDSCPGLGRNMQTMVWFAAGTLRELARALRDLRTALAKRGLLDASSKPWIALRDLEKRWENNAFFRDMRNIVAFHVDPKVMERGLAALEEEGDAILCEGLGDTQDQASMRLGLEALLNGSGKSLADFEEFMRVISEDHGISGTIHDAFVLVLEAKGVQTVDLRNDA